MRRREFIARGTAGVAVGVIGIGDAGCPTAQQWFQIAAGLVPIALQTVSSLQLGTGAFSPAVEAGLTTFSNDATTILNDVATDIGKVQADPTFIAKIDDLLTQLKSQANALVPQFLGTTTAGKWINAILADAIDLLSLVPIIQQTTSGTANARVTTVKVIKTRVSLPTAQSYQSIFKHRLNVVQAAA
jgi:hypothetical protein